jgi:hypothetical protein
MGMMNHSAGESMNLEMATMTHLICAMSIVIALGFGIKGIAPPSQAMGNGSDPS